MAKEELEDIIEYEDYEADYIEEPEELSDNDKVVQNSKGQVKFKSVNHSKRAEANERLISKKALIGKIIGFAPMIGVFVGYLILPLLVIGLSSIQDTFATMSV